MHRSIRFAAWTSLAVLSCACSAPKPTATATAAPVASAQAAAPAPAGPPNAPVPAGGKPGAIPLDPDQRQDLQRFITQVAPPLRPRLRYALALGDDGKRHLVVYDGGGLNANGRPAGAHDFVVFKVLNATDGSHYDPQSDELIAPLPVPPERRGGPEGGSS
jgi:hypothetical protein